MRFIIKDKNKDIFLIVYLLLLLFPALLINLGMMPFILDEATRATVALEMIFSGDYIHPTINGEFYLNKPPLFNWIQILFVKIANSDSELIFRIPVIISLLLFGLSIYLSLRKDFGRRVAFLTSFAVITSGRILFYDSFIGLIDISFSWLIYLIIWSVYYFGSKKQYYKLFLAAYFFASMAFMMKALPSLVFLGVTLLVWFISKGDFKRLFSLQHMAGFAVLILIVGGYLLIYNVDNPLENYFVTLWSESSKRTFIDNNILESVKHFFLFPFQFIYHFLPWTLLVILMLWKRNRSFVWENELSRYFLLTFIANILIYWVSPAIYARYLFMFLPMFFGTLFFVLFNNENEKFIRFFFKPQLLIISILFLILILISPLITDPQEYENFWFKYFFVLLLFIPLIIFARKDLQNYILLSLSVLLISRIVFNFYVIPHRFNHNNFQNQKNGAIMVGVISNPGKLFVMEGTRIQHASSFYIMRERNDILRYTNNMDDNTASYIIEKEKRGEYPPHIILYEFETRIKATKLCLVKPE
ncbi:MAG: glycosyltransferase family 39 protein [Bacteroidales bacterium]|nr:glycosyltransferase family 39 protein [Bacteroidales bacterium]